MPNFEPALVVSRDGTLAFRVQQEGAGRTVGGAEVTHLIFLSEDPQQSSSVVTLGVMFGLVGTGLVNSLGLPDSQSARTTALADSATGDHLDRHGSPFGRANYPPIQCDGAFVESLTKRAPAPELVARQYMRAKTWWAWKLDAGQALFAHSDALRLGVKLKTLQKLAEEEIGHLWKMVTQDYGAFNLTAQPALRKIDPRKRGPLVLGALVDVRPLLSAPRYSAATFHLNEAFKYAEVLDAPDLTNAAREGINALEALAKVVARESGTLGEIVKELRKQNRLHPSLAACLGALWGYTNEEAGIRHAGTESPTVKPAEATLAMNICAAAMLYLLEIDKT